MDEVCSIDDLDALLYARNEFSEPPEALFSASELCRDIVNVLKTIPDREARIVRERFGLDTAEKTLAEIGSELGMTKERVRQIESRAIKRLQRHSELRGHFESTPLPPPPLIQTRKRRVPRCAICSTKAPVLYTCSLCARLICRACMRNMGLCVSCFHRNLTNARLNKEDRRYKYRPKNRPVHKRSWRRKDRDVLVTIDGVTKPLLEWASEQGVPASLVLARVSRGWTVEVACQTPPLVPGVNAHRPEHPDPSLQDRPPAHVLQALAEANGIPYGRVDQRIRRGWPWREALEAPKGTVLLKATICGICGRSGHLSSWHNAQA